MLNANRSQVNAHNDGFFSPEGWLLPRRRHRDCRSGGWRPRCWRRLL